LRYVNFSDQAFSSVHYNTDALYRRIQRTLEGSMNITQQFLRNEQGRIAAELNSSGTVVSTFVYGTKPNVPDYMIRGGVTYRIVSDWLGNVRQVLNTSSNPSPLIVQQFDYDEFGNLLTSYDSMCAAGALCFPPCPRVPS
jgi:hypothetical protein